MNASSGGISDGFGSHLSTDEIIAELDGWAKHYAASIVPYSDGFFDELVQEARIEVWRKLEKIEEVNKSYLIQAMKWRMLSAVRQNAKKNGKTVAIDFNDLDPSLLEAPEALEGVEWSYHHGEMMQFIRTLRPELQEYVIRRFWYDQKDAQIAKDMGVYPSRVSRWWNNQIKPKMAEQFAHLSME